jgi:hypothetical protein
MNNLIQNYELILKKVKYVPSNYELIGDKGYLSADYQLDLFNQSQKSLAYP